MLKHASLKWTAFSSSCGQRKERQIIWRVINDTFEPWYSINKFHCTQWTLHIRLRMRACTWRITNMFGNLPGDAYQSHTRCIPRINHASVLNNSRNLYSSSCDVFACKDQVNARQQTDAFCSCFHNRRTSKCSVRIFRCEFNDSPAF
jgi:hypothetical protein